MDYGILILQGLCEVTGIHKYDTYTHTHTQMVIAILC